MNFENKTILILGSRGFLGKRVCRLLKKKKIKFISSNRKSCDLTNSQHIERYIKKKKPHIVINCAAFVGGIHFSRLYPYDVLFKNISLATS